MDNMVLMIPQPVTCDLADLKGMPSFKMFSELDLTECKYVTLGA